MHCMFFTMFWDILLLKNSIEIHGFVLYSAKRISFSVTLPAYENSKFKSAIERYLNILMHYIVLSICASADKSNIQWKYCFVI